MLGPKEVAAETPLAALQRMGKFTKAIENNALGKERSKSTHHDVHIPAIKAPLNNPENTQVVLFDDSMLERFKIKHPSTALNRRADTINLGVGGEKIQNAINRLSLGLLDELPPFPIKLWVIHIGSNNLIPGGGPLRPHEVAKLNLLLNAILCKSASDIKILLCGIFERKDMHPGQVSESKKLHVEMKNKLNKKMEKEIIFWVPMPETIDLNTHLEDKVGLNKAGYAIWDVVLSGRLEKLLK